LTALFLREVNRNLIALKEALESSGNGDDSPLEEAFAFTLAYLRGHGLVGKILTEPKGMLSVLALGGGAVLEAATRGVGDVLGPSSQPGPYAALRTTSSGSCSYG
jgi:hypothetical protein